MTECTTRVVRPDALRSGDRVHVISPSGPVIPENLADGLALLRQWDLDVIVDDHVFARRRPYDYLAGSDEKRLEAFLEAWTDPSCRAIVCSRGGYGAMRLLPHLDDRILKDNPKLLVGFSDITALHLYLAGRVGVATLHGPVVKSMSLDDASPHRPMQRLREALFATTEAPETWRGLRTIRPGQASGPLFGGNLSLLAALLATPYCPDLRDVVLVIEDVGEEDYRLDRLLTALRLSQRVEPAGLIFGDFTNCRGAYVSGGEFNDFLDHLAADFDCPIVAGAPVGHDDDNVCFPMGIHAELDARAGTLRFDSHATRSPNRN